MFWSQWELVSPRLPTLIIIPPLYTLVIVTLNTATYCVCSPGSHTSLAWAVLSTLLPRPDKGGTVTQARQLLVLNVSCCTNFNEKDIKTL